MAYLPPITSSANQHNKGMSCSGQAPYEVCSRYTGNVQKKIKINKPVTWVITLYVARPATPAVSDFGFCNRNSNASGRADTVSCTTSAEQDNVV